MELQNLKYNYIVIGSEGYYDYGYHDLKGYSNIIYNSNYLNGINNKIIKLLVHLCFSKKVNYVFNYPFSKIVYKRIFPFSFENDKPICFLFFSLPYIVNSSYIEFLKEKYSNSKIVLFYQDLVKTKNINIEKIRRKVDLILSYDKGDCEKYGLMYHPTPMSYVNIPQNNDLAQSDIYFCGFAKNRYALIHKLYKELSSLGLMCDFHIMDLPKGVEKICGINYEDRSFSYEENLQHVLKTKCILEIMQQNADGFTPRLWESIIYDRHLLTNNSKVYSSCFFNNYIHDIKNLQNIQKWINKTVSYNKDIKSSLSPINLVRFIDGKL